MAVTVQGYLALDLVKKNNVELMKGVDRASTTTVSALRTAVTVAQAMTNQKLVLEQITALNTTTANIIDSTGKLLRDNTARIHEQAASSTIPLETLQRAFQNIYDTMDAIDTFKLKALDSMKTTVNTLSTEVEKSQGLYRPRRGRAAGPRSAAPPTPSSWSRCERLMSRRDDRRRPRRLIAASPGRMSRRRCRGGAGRSARLGAAAEADRASPTRRS